MNRHGEASTPSRLVERFVVFGTRRYRTAWSIAFYGNLIGVFVVPLLFVPMFMMATLRGQPGFSWDGIVSSFTVNSVAWVVLAFLWAGAFANVLFFSWIRSIAKRDGSWQGV
jgi:hypothetical protein